LSFCYTERMIANKKILLKIQLLEYSLVIFALSFFIPLLISGPQILTGSLVNALLFLAAAYLPKKKVKYIVALPGIAAVLNGVIFGRFTPFLLYFLPFIWLGNYILIKSFLLLNKKMPYPVRILFSSFFKSVFLFTFAVIFFKLNLIPQLFLTVMGIFQFITAIIGGILFLTINKILNSKLQITNKS